MRKRNGAGAGSPCPARSSKRISYKKRLLINLGLIVALPPMTAKSQATKFLAFLLRFTKKIWFWLQFWLQHAKVPRILHAMNGICWNPHARKSAQGRGARGPNIPKSYRNFRQPPYIMLIHDNAHKNAWYIENVKSYLHPYQIYIYMHVSIYIYIYTCVCIFYIYIYTNTIHISMHIYIIRIF